MKLLGKIFFIPTKLILKILRSILLAFPMALGNIFYHKPHIENKPGSKEISKEKDD